MTENSLPPADELTMEPGSMAAHLWTLLSQLHTDMNSCARSNVKAVVTDAQKELINSVLDQVRRLLSQSGRAQNLRLLDRGKDINAGEALLLLGHFKGSLRAYRVSVLNESHFSF